MTVYLISYDLNKTKDYKSLYEAIEKSCNAWWHYLDSTWLIDSTLPLSTINQNIKSVIDNDDFYFIVQVTNQYKGWLPQDAWNWIYQHIG